MEDQEIIDDRWMVEKFLQREHDRCIEHIHNINRGQMIDGWQTRFSRGNMIDVQNIYTI